MKRKRSGGFPAAVTKELKSCASRAGSLTPAERSALYDVAADAVRALEEDDRVREAAARAAREDARAKRLKAAAADADAGARLGDAAPARMRRLPRVVVGQCLAFLTAADFRDVFGVKCFRGACARDGVRRACAAIAPYAEPPQLSLPAARGFEPLAVLEDALAAAAGRRGISRRR